MMNLAMCATGGDVDEASRMRGEWAAQRQREQLANRYR